MALLLLLLFLFSASAEYLGELSANPYATDSTANHYGSDIPFKPDGINSLSSNRSSTNPCATDASRLYDQQGNYRGKLNTNSYDSDSVSDPYGRYGSLHSSESLNNNLYGAGNLYRSDSPTNPYDSGWGIDR